MTKINVLLASLTVIGLMASCGGGSSSNSSSKEDENQITMTVKSDKEISFSIAGNGEAAIDWGDGSVTDSIDLSNAETITYYHEYSEEIEYVITLTGDITYLQCENCGLTSLDVSNNTVLTELNCPENHLTSLDVSNNTMLTDLYCDGNKLTSLDLSKNTNLVSLGCDSNNLTSLNVSKNTNLTSLSCGFNRLTSLDVSANTMLESLYCDRNNLTSLDVSNNTMLVQLNCPNNNLTSLDLIHNTELTRLSCENNNLTSLDLSNKTKLAHCVFDNNKLEKVDLSNDPELWYVTLLNNQMSVAALNAMMTGLHSNYLSSGQDLFIDDNPGSNNCNTNIAWNKGWRIDVDNDSVNGIIIDAGEEDPMKERISKDIFALPEMKFPHAAIMFVSEPSDDRPYYVVEGGSNMPTQFVGSLWFHVYTTPKYEIKVLDMATATEMTLDQWRTPRKNDE